MTNPLYDTLFGRHTGSETPFLILPDGKIVTYDAFLRRASQFANALVACGVQPGDRVAAQIGKSADALALYAACTQTGAVFLPLNTAYTASELTYFVQDSGAVLLVGDPAKAPELTTLVAEIGTMLQTLGSQADGTFAELAADCAETFQTVARDGEDLAAFLYTSGTTGRSKGAMLSQNNLLSNAETLTDLWQFTDADVLLHALPIFHTHGLFVATNVILNAGGSMVFLPGLDIDALIRFFPQATSMMGVPTFYTRLLGDARFTRDLVDHMRLFISGSAPLLAETHVSFETRTGHRILERYGMTETNMNTSNPYKGNRRAGTVGFPLPGVDLRICDPSSRAPLPAGTTGSIEVRGPNVFKGYWNMPEKTAEELREDGFFITGDLGTIDEDGYVSIVGRSKDLIISGGYNIYPKEVELLLDEQPGILESAVIGVPHADFGEAVMGILVADGTNALDLATVQDTIAKDLARYKQPKKLVVLDALPRNTMGKVQKNLLRDQFQNSFTAGGASGAG